MNVSRTLAGHASWPKEAKKGVSWFTGAEERKPSGFQGLQGISSTYVFVVSSVRKGEGSQAKQLSMQVRTISMLAKKAQVMEAVVLEG